MGRDGAVVMDQHIPDERNELVGECRWAGGKGNRHQSAAMKFKERTIGFIPAVYDIDRAIGVLAQSRTRLGELKRDRVIAYVRREVVCLVFESPAEEFPYP